MPSCKLHATVSWIFQSVAAAILLQTLFFKFTGAAESKYIFTTLGVEPWGRIATGTLELLATVLLLRGRWAVFGALLAIGLMFGAIVSHLTKLELVVQDDGGLLFALAVTVFGASVIVVWLHRFRIPYVGALLFTSNQEGCSNPTPSPEAFGGSNPVSTRPIAVLNPGSSSSDKMIPPTLDNSPTRPESVWQSLGVEAVPDEHDLHARRILAAALEILDQGERLLGALDPETFASRVPVAFNASIGGHYRHCLDHFTSLLRGLDTDRVDYDHRERDPRLENEPGFALNLTRQVRAQLQQVSPDRLATRITARCEVSYAHGDSPVTQSTFGRELVYAIAHSIHHYALISVMARLQNATLPPNFGVAPSTVAHPQPFGSR